MSTIPFASFLARPAGRFERGAAALLPLLLVAPLMGPLPALAQSQQQAQSTVRAEDFREAEGLARVLAYLRQGGDPNVVLDRGGNTLMHYAASVNLAHDSLGGRASAVLAEAIARDGNCDARNSHGVTPLHIAASRQSILDGVENKLVRPFIACSESLNAKDEHGNTPLHAAYEGAAGDLAAPMKLISGILRLDTTAFDSSMEERSFYHGGAVLPIVRVLLDAGADPNARDAHGGAPLMMAIRHRGIMPGERLKHVRFLLRYDADPNVRDPEHGSLLIATLKQNHIDPPDETVPILAALLRAGADPNARDRSGDTPLIHAAGQGRNEPELDSEIRELLAAGADPCIADRSGKFPVQHARDGGNRESERLLREAGGAVDPNTGECGHVADDAGSTSGDSASESQAASSPPAPTPVCTGYDSACWMELSNQPGCYIWHGYAPEHNHQHETVTWSGSCTDGKASGKGEILWNFIEDGIRLTSRGTGELRDGKQHGRWDWVTEFANGDVGEGPYMDGKQHGRWKFRRPGVGLIYNCFNNGVNLGDTTRWRRCP